MDGSFLKIQIFKPVQGFKKPTYFELNEMNRKKYHVLLKSDFKKYLSAYLR
jgi:hypothetical protein